MQTSEVILRGTSMTYTTLTLALGGDVPLDQFALTMERFQRLIEQLTQEVGQDAAIKWIVDELSAGSAVITIRGESEQLEAVERVGRAYTVIGQSLEHHQPIPYSPQIARAAENITQVLNGQITSIQFEAGDDIATVTSSIPVEQAAALLGAYGSVEGRVETLTSRRGLGFTLYDLLHDRAIRCHLGPDQADSVRDAWDRRVIVRGWVRRDPSSGRPVSINPVQSIDLVPDIAPGSYRQARGIAPARPGESPSHVTVRRLRDA
jgi:hypothetical protein